MRPLLSFNICHQNTEAFWISFSKRHTQLTVKSIEDGMLVKAKTVYVLPPNKEAILCQNRLLLTDRSQERSVIYPIDDFLRSLANESCKQAIGVIFSGTGADGSRGIRDLHSAGGFVIAQNPNTAAFAGMPKNAISTGVVDLVLSPREAAKAIVRKLERGPNDSLMVEDSPTYRDFNSLAPGMEIALGTLRSRLGIDYTELRASTVFEAIQRRQNHTGLDKGEAYAELLLQNDNEASCLVAELVRSERPVFFCDDVAYERLSLDVIPTLMSTISDDQDFRAWVIGCSTGQEVYTLAMLLAEWYEHKGLPQRVKILPQTCTQSHCRLRPKRFTGPMHSRS